jgi:NAD(P)H-dependent FMN reductase
LYKIHIFKEATLKILAFAGSTREDSYNQKLLEEAALVARSMGAEVTIIHLREYPMPFYDGDLEKQEGMPKNAQRLRQLMIASDAIIITSPEYNASVSSVLKNAIDWASRGENGGPSRDAFKEKNFAIMSASPSKMGGTRGLKHLRAILENVGAIVVEEEVAIPEAHLYFSQEETKENPSLRKALEALFSINTPS